jgi:hypothetical protein
MHQRTSSRKAARDSPDILGQCLRHLTAIDERGCVDEHSVHACRLTSKTFKDVVDSLLCVTSEKSPPNTVQDLIVRDLSWEPNLLEGCALTLKRLVLHDCRAHNLAQLPPGLQSLHLVTCTLPPVYQLERVLPASLQVLRIIDCRGPVRLRQLGKRPVPANLRVLELQGPGAGACLWLRSSLLPALHVLAVCDTRSDVITVSHVNSAPLPTVQTLCLCGHASVQNIFGRLEHAVQANNILIAGFHEVYFLHCLIFKLSSAPNVQQLHIHNCTVDVSLMPPTFLQSKDTFVLLDGCALLGTPPPPHPNVRFCGACTACANDKAISASPLCDTCSQQHQRS